MVSLYKRLLIVYFFVAVLCMIGGGIFLNHFRNTSGFVVYLITMIAILYVTISILSGIAKKRFKNEVLSLFDNCCANAYIEEVKRLLSKKRSRRFVSMYACLLSVGYDVLGDYRSLYESCLKIKDKSYMPYYHRRMFTYFLSIKDLTKAKEEIEELEALAASSKNKAELEVINCFLNDCNNALKFHLGNLDGVEEYYTQMLNKGDIPLISRVSYAYALSEVLIAKNRKEEAKDHLIFASSRGGDTKYKTSADKLLEMWS